VEQIGWRVVSEASDGLEAVQKAREFAPDVILLDIGLPKLNGLDAARQVRLVAPDSRILFLSANNLPDIVEAALNTGASGYVLKLVAVSELVAAVKAVSQGKRFVSNRIEGLSPDGPSAELPEPTDPFAIGNHRVQFYSEETVFQQSVAAFIGSSLRTGNAAILFATRPHRDAVFQELHSQGFDVNAAIQRGTYVPLDAAEVLSISWLMTGPTRTCFLELSLESSSPPRRQRKLHTHVWRSSVKELLSYGRKVRQTRLSASNN
jgi:CheY-like chemotaxis protein